MSTAAIGLPDLLRDVRHLSARAAPDLDYGRVTVEDVAAKIAGLRL